MAQKLISIRIPEDVLLFFKESYQDGYQKEIKKLLADHMIKSQTHNLLIAGRAQQLFIDYYAQCFWHYDRNLQITPSNMNIVIEGLRKHGGKKGFILASELCQ